ncbi:MAG TPA: flagellar motor protein MotB [Alphaproteobacteria bacterium]|nr:flagellar motor protein MotB [Alphaproteobacteria bacterium]
MADGDGDKRPIVIKKVKKIVGGHHGGAWKVAYADFVTAMMAFFLLMWLLGATTEDQRKGIAEYFDPIAVSQSQSGAGEILGGKSPNEPGSQISDAEPTAVAVTDRPGVQGNEESPPVGQVEDEENINEEIPKDPGSGQEGSDGAEKGVVSAATAAQIKEAKEALENARKEEQKFQETKEKIIEVIQNNPDMAGLTKNLIVDETPEGLRIQIIDTDGTPMFESGGSTMSDSLKKILSNVIAVIKDLPNKLSIRGHTDATPFKGSGRDNWDLSAERANASRREVVNLGINPDRVVNVVGRADREPLLPDAPKDPQNRRIGIILMREFPAKPPAEAATPPAQ